MYFINIYSKSALNENLLRKMACVWLMQTY